MIQKWKTKLELSDWSISTIRIEPDQVVCDCPPEDCYFVGIYYIGSEKKGLIYHDRPLTEEDVVHELLHVKYPDWSEDQVNAETEKLLKEEDG